MNTQPASKDDPAISPLARRAAAVCDWFANLSAWGWMVVGIVALLIVGNGFPSHRDAGVASRETASARTAMTDLQKFWLAAEVTVREHLENPDKAVFCAANDPLAETLMTTSPRYGEGAAMRGWVKEKRLDGTSRLLAWGALIVHDKDGFRALGCQINEREFGIYKEAKRQ